MTAGATTAPRVVKHLSNAFISSALPVCGRFPTGTKLRGGGDKIQTLIINAAECEPYITADDRLMQDCAAQVVEGYPYPRAHPAAARCADWY